MFKNVFLAISLLCAAGSFNVNAAAAGAGYFYQELHADVQVDAHLFVRQMLQDLPQAQNQMRLEAVEQRDATLANAQACGIFIDQNDLLIAHNYLQGLNNPLPEQLQLPDHFVQMMLQLLLVRRLAPDHQQLNAAVKAGLRLLIILVAGGIRGIALGNALAAQQNNNQ